MNLNLRNAKQAGRFEPHIVDQIIQVFFDLEKVCYAEAMTKKIYVLPSRGFNSDFLLNEPSKLFRDGAYDKLEEIAKSDISSACRCILFGEATASAFHILRATESVLKSITTIIGNRTDSLSQFGRR